MKTGKFLGLSFNSDFLCIFDAYNNGGSPSVNQKADYRYVVSKRISYELENEVFMERSRGTPKKVFIRDRKLPLKKVIMFILSIKSALQRDLDRFFAKVKDSSFNIREVTKGGFSSARKKLDPWAFQRLNEVAVDSFYSEVEYYGWAGYRVVSVDGSRAVLPNHPSVKKEFGEHLFGPKADSKRSLATFSMVYDVFNHVTLDAAIAPYTTSEQTLLMTHLDKLSAGDLLLLDRG